MKKQRSTSNTRHILITAGPTRENLDPIRFLSNRSTGKMGFALAECALKRGHTVSLVSGPTQYNPPRGADFYPVETARQMKQAVDTIFPQADCLIMSAAVCDFMPERSMRRKIKKTDHAMTITLKRTPDILKACGRKKGKRVLIGFALEIPASIDAAGRKLKEKRLDIIVHNSALPTAAPFGENRVAYHMLMATGEEQALGVCSKSKLAQVLLDKAEKLMVC